MIEPGFLELAKSGGLFCLLAYMLWSDRQQRDKDREADIKRSEAVLILGKATEKMMDYLNRRDKKEGII